MMNKLLISLFLSSVITLGGCGLTKENYYVKHVEFPQDATLEQKIDMAARLVPTPQQATWQQMELTAFLHFGINTFTGRDSKWYFSRQSIMMAFVCGLPLLRNIR